MSNTEDQAEGSSASHRVSRSSWADDDSGMALVPPMPALVTVDRGRLIDNYGNKSQG